MSLNLAQAARAASAYRAMIRAQRFTFKGDEFALQAGQQQARLWFSQFVPSAFLPAASASATIIPSSPVVGKQVLSEEEVNGHIDSAFEIALYIRRNVVQGKQKDDGNFALRFTPETERGSNDTIKAPSLKEARPLRPPLESADGSAVPTGNEGVKRRRRKGPPAITIEE